MQKTSHSKNKIVLILFVILAVIVAVSVIALLCTHKHTYGEYDFNTKTHFKLCTDCGEILTVEEHVLTEEVVAEPTCCTKGTAKLTCCVCGYSETHSIATTNHLYTTQTVAPTCSQEGYTLHTCENCAYSYVDDVVPATDLHSPVLVNAVASTCTTQGNTAYYKCLTCNKIFQDYTCTTELSGDVLLPLQSHLLVNIDYTSPTCTQEGCIAHYECAHCGQCFEDEQAQLPLQQVSIPQLSHLYTPVTYNLVTSASAVVDGEKYLLVALVNGNYYLASTSNYTFVPVQVSNNAITQLPTQAQLFEINGSDVDGCYTLFVQNGTTFGKYLGSAKGMQLAESVSPTANNAKWDVTFDTKGQLNCTSQSTDESKCLSYSTQQNQLSCCSKYDATHVKLLLFVRTLNDVQEVATDSGTLQYHKCELCNKTYDNNEREIIVDVLYREVEDNNALRVNDVVILVNKTSSYSVKADNLTTTYNVYGRITDKALSDDEYLQQFTLKRSMYDGCFRYNVTDTAYYLYVPTTLTPNNSLARNTNVTTSQNRGSFTYENGTLKEYSCDAVITCNATKFKLALVADSNITLYKQVATVTYVNPLQLHLQVDPTCTSYGIQEHYTDGTGYFNSEMQQVSYNTLIIDKLQHDYRTCLQVPDADYHVFVCSNDNTHCVTEPCRYSNGVCVVCGNTQITHVHTYVVQCPVPDALISVATCKDYAKYKYTCTCGAISDELTTWEYVDGGYCEHNFAEIAYTAPTCTAEGCTDTLYCTVCGFVKYGTTLQPTGHDYDNGNFVFDDINNIALTTGTWTYTCRTCNYVHTYKSDITNRPGSDDYAYKQIANGLFANGKKFYVTLPQNNRTDNFNAYSLVQLASYTYKRIFEICEAVLDSDKDYTVEYLSGDSPSTSLGHCNLDAIVTPEISVNLLTFNPQTNDYKCVPNFMREICKWFKADHPEYYFLNADTWSHSRTTTGNKVTFTFKPTMYGTFAKASVRKNYQQQLDEFTQEHTDKYTHIADERLRAKAIYNEVMQRITYTYGPGADKSTSGDSVAPNTIIPLLDGKGVCESYGMGFCYICRLNGLVAINVSSEIHAYAYLKVTGYGWYMVDPTWGDGEGKVKNETIKYFCRTVTGDDLDHTTRPTWFPLPELADKQLSY